MRSMLVLAALWGGGAALDQQDWYSAPGQPTSNRFLPAMFQEPGIYNPVPDINLIVPETRSSYRAAYDSIMADPNLSPEEKQRRIQAHFDRLKSGIVVERRAFYERSYLRAHVNHSCTRGRNSSGTRRCPAVDEHGNRKCYTVAQEGMTTRAEWAGLLRTSSLTWTQFNMQDGPDRFGERRIGHVVGTVVPILDGGRTFCAPPLRKSSSGFIRDISYAYFGYDDAYIAQAVERDATYVMARATS